MARGSDVARWLVRACAAGAAAALAVPAAVAAATTYPIYGAGDDPLRPGIAASMADINSQPIGLAVRSDGVVAFSTDGVVYWVQAGRLLRVPVPAHGDLDLAFAPDGRLVVAACSGFDVESPAAVFSAAPGRAASRIAGSLQRTGSSGDGGPATAATLKCPSGVDVDTDGGILVADGDAARVRRIGPDGTIATVAGTGVSGTSGDGGPAIRAQLRSPSDVAALPGGGFAILDRPRGVDPGGRSRIIRVVDPGGVIRTLRPTDATRISATPDGALLLVDWGDDDGTVRRLALDGTLKTVARVRDDRVGITPWIPVAGDPFGTDAVQVDTAVSAPDGGALVGADFAIQYIAPPSPAILGLALLPATRRAARRLTVTMRTTIAANVRVGVWKRGRRVLSATATVSGGDATIPFAASLRPGEYDVRVRATAGSQIAHADATVLVGGLLPIAYARDFIQSRFELFRRFQDAPPSRLRCRRMGNGRVDCQVIQHRRCVGLATLALRPDGTLSVAGYGGPGKRCRFRR